MFNSLTLKWCEGQNYINAIQTAKRPNIIKQKIIADLQLVHSPSESLSKHHSQMFSQIIFLKGELISELIKYQIGYCECIYWA